MTEDSETGIVADCRRSDWRFGFRASAGACIDLIIDREIFTTRVNFIPLHMPGSCKHEARNKKEPSQTSWKKDEIQCLIRKWMISKSQCPKPTGSIGSN